MLLRPTAPFPFHNSEEQQKTERKRERNKKKKTQEKGETQKNEGKVEMFAQQPVSSVIRPSPSTSPPAEARPSKFPCLLAKIINQLL
jgi:hypothetical protein